MGKVALVAGGTAGVGRGLVEELVNSGATVHFIGTHSGRGRHLEQTLNEVRSASAHFVQLDLSNLAEVQAFGTRFAAEVPQLDLLAHMAGVLLVKREVTPDGIEKTLAVNHVSAFVLARALAPTLARGTQPRIVLVSGKPSKVIEPRLDIDGLDDPAGYNAITAALDGVHAKTVLAELLAERLADQHIDVNAVHPGAVRSELGRHLPLPLRVLLRMAQPFLASHSRAVSRACFAPEVTGITGHLFAGTSHTPLRFPAAYKERLWDWTQTRVRQALDQPDS